MIIKQKLEKKLLTEAISDIKKLVWPNLNPLDVIRIMRFSSSWKPDLELAEIEVELSDQEYNNIIAALDKFYEKKSQVNNLFKIQKPQNNTSSNFLIFKGDKDLLNSFISFASAVKLNKIIQKKNDEELIINGNPEQQIQLFSLFNSLKNNEQTAKELSDLQAKSIKLMQSMKDKSISADAKQTIIADMKTTGAKLSSMINSLIKTELTPEEQTEFETLKPNNNNNKSKYKITGYFCPVFGITTLCGDSEFINSEDSFSHALTHMPPEIFLKKPNVIHEYDNNLITKLCLESGSNFDYMSNNIKLLGDADEETRWLIQTCNNELVRSSADTQKKIRSNIEFEEKKLTNDLTPDERRKTEQILANYRKELDLPIFRTIDDLILYLKQKKIGFLTRYYSEQLNEPKNKIKRIKDSIASLESAKNKLAKKENALSNEKDDTKKEKLQGEIHNLRREISSTIRNIPTDADGNIIFDEEAERKKLPPDFATFKTLDSLIANINNQMKLSADSAGQQAEPNLQTDCAKRRMKLFAAATRRGASVYTFKDWVIAFLPTAKAAQPFGRFRPKVDKNGHIIPECNLEDWEGITPENKIKRDSEAGNYIKDGLYTVHAHETKWCTSGWERFSQRRWGNEVGPGNMFNNYNSLGGLIVFMDNRTGYLYQYGSGQLLDECDGSGGILANASNMKSLLVKYPTLASALISTGLTKYIRSSDQPEKTKDQVFQELLDSGLITTTGSAYIKSLEDFRKIYPVIDFIYEIQIAPYADIPNIFSYLRTVSREIKMPTVDLNSIENASFLFSDLHLTNDILRLKNTDSIKHANAMFKNLKFISKQNSEIIGLNTENIVNAPEMFFGCRNSEYRGIKISELNLKSCINLDHCFTSSGFTSIPFKNTDKVITAKGAFQNCFMLETIPDIRFKSIKYGSSLINNFNGNNYIEIFSGCNALLKKYRTQKPSKENNDPSIDNKFDEIIEKVIKPFYEDKKHVLQNLDSRGYLIINNSEDANDAAVLLTIYKDIKGIVIGKTAQSKNLFSNLKLHIKSLDLNGRTDVSYLFNNCTINELGEIIGGENVTNSDSMFYYTKCNIYPTIEFPKCSELDTFYNAGAPYDIPDIKYSPLIKELQDYGIDIVGDDNNITEALCRNICNKLFGGYNVSTWIDNNGATRLASIMYIDPLRKSNENIIEKVRKDERGYYIIDHSINNKIIQRLLKYKPKGFVFDSEFVADANSNVNFDIDIFRKLKIDNMPIIDFNGLHNCSCMFEKSSIDKFEGFEHTDQITTAVSMFKYTKSKNPLPALNLKNLTKATGMFTYATIPGFSSTLNLENLEDATDMFYYYTSIKIPFEKNIILPKVKYANRMFEGMQPTQTTNIENIILPECVSAIGMFRDVKFYHPINIEKISMPKCTNVSFMFYKCTNLRSIKEIDIGQNAVDSYDGMNYMFRSSLIEFIGTINASHVKSCEATFRECTRLKRIGKINMPDLENCNEMFYGATSLLNICSISIPSTVTHRDMFFNTELGNRVYGRNGDALINRLRLLSL